MNPDLLCQIEITDALTLMRSLPDRSIDCIITDPPYDATNLALDKAIDWAEFWHEANRISKTPAIRAWFAYHQSLVHHRACHNCKALRYEVVLEEAQAQLKWLISIYSAPGDLVLDPFLGSGNTAIACQELGRHFIGGDSNPEYVAIARERVAQTAPSLLYA